MSVGRLGRYRSHPCARGHIRSSHAAANSPSSSGEIAMSDGTEIALEHKFPTAWTFLSMVLAGGLGWMMLDLITMA
jgi:hypothetical protein